MIYKLDKYKEVVKEVIADFYHIVGSTYGPNGKTVMLYNAPLNQAYMTKDGYTVASELNYVEVIKDNIASIIKQTCLTNAKEVGDGTTTSIVIMSRIFEMLENGSLSLKDVDSLLQTLTDKIKENSVKPNGKILLNILKTSLNGDSNTAELLHDTLSNYSSYKKLNIELFQSRNKKSISHQFFEGFNIESQGSFRTQFPQELDSEDGEMYAIALSDSAPVTQKTMHDLLQVYMRSYKDRHGPLFVIARDFPADVVTYMKNATPAFPVIPVNLQSGRDSVDYFLQDISIYLDCGLVSSLEIENAQKRNGLLNFGNFNHFQATPTNLFLHKKYYRGPASDKLKTHVNLLVQAKKEAHNEKVIEFLQKRLNSLTCSTLHIYVSGITDVESKELFDRVEDAVGAYQATLKSNFIIGGGTALFHACRDTILEPHNLNLGIFLVHQLNTSFNNTEDTWNKLQVCNSDFGFNALTEEIEDLKELGIVEPTDHLIHSLKSGFSVAVALHKSSAACTNDAQELSNLMKQ